MHTMHTTATAATGLVGFDGRPVAVARRTHYYQGRPNTVFLDRYRTGGVALARHGA